MLSTFQIVDCSKIRLEGGRKKRNKMDQTADTAMIFMLRVTFTKTLRRFVVAFAINRVTEWKNNPPYQFSRPFLHKEIINVKQPYEKLSKFE